MGSFHLMNVQMGLDLPSTRKTSQREVVRGCRKVLSRSQKKIVHCFSGRQRRGADGYTHGKAPPYPARRVTGSGPAGDGRPPHQVRRRAGGPFTGFLGGRAVVAVQGGGGGSVGLPLKRPGRQAAWSGCLKLFMSVNSNRFPRH